MSAVTGTPATSGAGTQNTVSGNALTAQDNQALNNQFANVDGYTQNFQHAGNITADQSENSRVNLGTGFQGARLNTQFQGPQFSQGLNTTSQNLISSELGNRQAQLQRQQQTLQQKVGGGLGRVLGSQAASQSMLSNNPLALQAFQQQYNQEANTYGLQQGAQQATNQARLAQVDSGNNAINMGNQAQLAQQSGNLGALNQAFNQRQGLLGNQQNLLTQIGAMAQLRGEQYNQAATTQNTEAVASPLVEHLKSGGTAGKLGNAIGIGPQQAGANPKRTAAGPMYWVGTNNGTANVT